MDGSRRLGGREDGGGERPRTWGGDDELDGTISLSDVARDVPLLLRYVVELMYYIRFIGYGRLRLLVAPDPVT